MSVLGKGRSWRSRPSNSDYFARQRSNANRFMAMAVVGCFDTVPLFSVIWVRIMKTTQLGLNSEK